jgi:hypothetical protein
MRKTPRNEEHDYGLVAESGEKIEHSERQGLGLQVLEVHEKKVGRWPTITAQAAIARIKSRESDAAAVSLRVIHEREIGDGSLGLAPCSAPIVCVAIRGTNESIPVTYLQCIDYRLIGARPGTPLVLRPGYRVRWSHWAIVGNWGRL